MNTVDSIQHLEPGFRVDFLFPDEYSDFIAEIYYNERLVLIISQERGLDDADVEFDSDVRGTPERMRLRGLESAITYSKQRLRELRKSE